MNVATVVLAPNVRYRRYTFRRRDAYKRFLSRVSRLDILTVRPDRNRYSVIVKLP